MAIVGWAIGLESFVNHAWNTSVSKRLPSRSLSARLLRSLNTIDKIEELVALERPRPHESPVWLPDVKLLFDLRNRLAHYKATVSYQGFEFAPAITWDLREEMLERQYRGVREAVLDLGRMNPSLRTSFLDGDYRISFNTGEDELYDLKGELPDVE